MTNPRSAEDEAVTCHCGWTDPRDKVNWHVSSYSDPANGLIIAFRRPSESTEFTYKNPFGRLCNHLDDHEVAELLDLALKAANPGSA